ncbi:MAG: CPBP family intramembrane metalloprotease [Deltaproteobacteria bacterium]|nr:CPBP family intramembrane metalloprotease [Deltaproteobacteria bacterium]
MLPILYTISALSAYYLVNYAFPIRDVWIYQILFFFIPAVTAIYRFLPEPGQLLAMTRPWTRPILTVFGLSLLVSVVLNLFIPLWDHFFPAPEGLRDLIRGILQTDSLLDVLRLTFTIGLFPAICEETLFRGYLQTALANQWSPPRAVVVTSLIFALSHLNPWLFLFYFLLGLFLGWCRNYRNNLYLPILAHWVNNMIALAVFQLM